MEPTPLHHHLASLPLTVIVEYWYDGPMRTAPRTRDGWGEVQGIARSDIRVDCWYPIYDPAGQKLIMPRRPHWPTVLRKPHGSVLPVKSFLITDAELS